MIGAVRRTIGARFEIVNGYKGPDVGETYNVTKARQLIAESSYKDVKNLPRLRLGGS